MFPLVVQRMVHLVQRFNQFQPGSRAFRNKNSIEAVDAMNDGTKKPRPKTVPVPKITLISPDNSIRVTVLEEAERLAKRRNLILSKITDCDSKTQRAVYKLMNNVQYEGFEEIDDNKERDKNKQTLKATKLFYISAKIAEYDLRTKLKKTIKLLKKHHKIKFVITLDDNPNNMKNIIEDMMKGHGSIQYMPSKKNMLLLIITPVSNNDTDSKAEKAGTNDRSNSA
ncbi:hypothetical protein HN011_003767 [Eciton burchellii]|nr:hypothetical protein HN011_003767 [Eciton burchellii]